MNDAERAEYRTVVQDCLERRSMLTTKEVEFVESVRRQLTETRHLSRKQVTWMDDIWGRVSKQAIRRG